MPIPVSLDVHDLADKHRVQADLEVIQQSALDDQRELSDIGRIHEFAFDWRPARHGKLVHIIAGNEAKIVGIHHAGF